MRIAHLVSYFPPDRIGGVGEVAWHIHRGLLRKGIESHVFTAGTSKDDPTVTRFSESKMGFVFKGIGLAYKLRNYDLVHCHQGDGLPLIACSRVVCGRTKLLTTVHSSNYQNGLCSLPYAIEGRRFGAGWFGIAKSVSFGWVKHCMDLAAIALSDRVSFISRFGACEFGMDTAPVIYNGVPEAVGDRSDDDAIVETDLLYVGTASHRKRVNILPFLVSELQKQLGRLVTIRVVGFDEQDWPEFFRLAASLEVAESIICDGKMRASEIMNRYRRSKVIVVPSAYEGLPMVIGESQMLGVPCVASDVSAHDEAIQDGKNGFLVPVDSLGGFVSATEKLLCSRSLRDRMSECSKSHAQQQFSLARQVEQYVDLYQLMIAANEAP